MLASFMAQITNAHPNDPVARGFLSNPKFATMLVLMNWEPGNACAASAVDAGDPDGTTSLLLDEVPADKKHGLETVLGNIMGPTPGFYCAAEGAYSNPKIAIKTHDPNVPCARNSRLLCTEALLPARYASG